MMDVTGAALVLEGLSPSLFSKPRASSSAASTTATEASDVSEKLAAAAATPTTAATTATTPTCTSYSSPSSVALCLEDEDSVARISSLTPLTRMSMVGHRGCSSSAPENTLASMRLAFERGADGVEFDVQRSSDGAIFLLHDSTLRRTADPACPPSLLSKGYSQEDYQTMLDLDVSELEYDDFIRHVPVGTWRRSQDSDDEVQYPCLMTEVMTMLPTGKYVLCEVKGGDQASAKALAQLVEDEGWTSEQLKFIGFDLEVMVELKRDLARRCLEYIPVIFLKDVVDEEDAVDTVRVAQEASLDGVDFQADVEMVTARVVDMALANGLCIGVWVWNVLPMSDTVETAAALKDIGVQFFTSDLPSSMCRWMTEDALK